MFKFIRRLLEPKEIDLREKLTGLHTVKIQGVLFRIKKIDLMNYLEGARVLHETFSLYKSSQEKKLDEKMIKNVNKAKDYMRDIIMAGVVKPELTRNPDKEPDAFPVDEILNDWVLSQELTAAIFAHTYGKKN